MLYYSVKHTVCSPCAQRMHQVSDIGFVLMSLLHTVDACTPRCLDTKAALITDAVADVHAVCMHTQSCHVSSKMQFGFVYVRQLALHLRQALLKKTKEAVQEVLRWQYCSCLRLWAAVISGI
jgi:Noc2p family